MGLPRSCFVNHSSYSAVHRCSFAPRCSSGTALILTSQLCRGLAGGRIGRWGWDWHHGIAPRYLGKAGLLVTLHARMKLICLRGFVTILQSCRPRGCQLLPISWVSKLSATCRLSCVRGPGVGAGVGNCSPGGITSPGAVPLNGLTTHLRGRADNVPACSGRVCP